MTLALIAGNGALPAALVARLPEAPLMCVFEGCTPQGVTPDLSFRLETIGTLLQELTQRGVDKVCLVGGLERPVLDPSKLDAATRPLVPKVMAALQQGDDGALRIAVGLFKDAGMTVLSAQQLAPDLLARAGVLSAATPNEAVRENADVGARYIAEMGPRDIGQACLVADAGVYAMEGSAGTDALVAGAGTALAGRQAILFKGPKPDQTRLVDLPTIGPETVRRAIDASLAGIVVEAEGVLMLDRATCVEMADAAGLVLWVRPAK